MTSFVLNGTEVSTDVEPDTPLLWVIRDTFGLTGTKYGCGIAACGSCTVHVDGFAVRSCSINVEDIDGAEITTIEGLSEDGSHPVQKAWVEEQVPQCGYCQSGQIMAASAFLADNPNPTDEEIKQGQLNLCRCGTYQSVFRAIKRASEAQGA